MVKLFRHARMIRVVGAWKRWSSGKNLKRQKMAIAAAHFKKNSQFKVLWAMRDYREDRIQRKNLRTKLENKCRSILLSHLVVEWQEQWVTRAGICTYAARPGKSAVDLVLGMARDAERAVERNRQPDRLAGGRRRQRQEHEQTENSVRSD